MRSLAALLDDPDSWQDLHSVYAAVRREGPIHRDPDGAIFVLGHAAANSILKDRAFGVTDLLALYGITSGPTSEWWSRVMFSLNPPDHTRIRSTVSRAFTPRAVGRLREYIREVAGNLLDEAVRAQGHGGIDIIEAYANELPSRVMSHLLAIPDQDHKVFSSWTADIGLIFGAAAAKDAGLLHHIEDVLGRLYEYIARLSAQRRRHPGDDLLSLLTASQESSERLAPDELAALIANLLFAGHDTTRSQLMIAFDLFASHPDQFDLLKADPTLFANASEEVLRYEPSVVGTARAPFEDTVVGDLAVTAGTPIQLQLMAASRDPEVYQDPDVFNVRRAHPEPPLTFGGGIHHCLGAALARAELEETLKLVSRRYVRMEPVETSSWIPYAAIRRFSKLKIRLCA